MKCVTWPNFTKIDYLIIVIYLHYMYAVVILVRCGGSVSPPNHSVIGVGLCSSPAFRHWGDILCISSYKACSGFRHHWVAYRQFRAVPCSLSGGGTGWCPGLAPLERRGGHTQETPVWKVGGRSPRSEQDVGFMAHSPPDCVFWLPGRVLHWSFVAWEVSMEQASHCYRSH